MIDENLPQTVAVVDDLGPTPSSPQPGELATVTPLPVEQVAELGQQVLNQVGTAVVGMRDSLTIALATILAGGHVLFEDVPGLGKTLAARSLAAALGLDFARLQCTPDLLPSDITGSSIFDPATRTFVFQPGPIFTDIFLADEINRTAPKTQSALLEAMAEHQVSVDGVTRKLPETFSVIATSNPVEYEGTYPLPEAQLDRFMVRLAVGYLDPADEAVVLERRIGRRQEATSVQPIVDAATVQAMRAGIEAVDVDPDVVRYCVDIAAATRASRLLEVGASPRGSQNLLLLSRAMAVLDGRDYVLPEDVKAVAIPVLAHRLTLTPQAWASGVSPEKIVTDILAAIPGPATVRRASAAQVTQVPSGTQLAQPNAVIANDGTTVIL